MPILVVEDDEDTRWLLRLALSEWGYSVVCAADGAEAMDFTRQVTPAVILLDLWLPRVSGFAFRSWLLQQPQLAHVPVIVITAAGPAAADPVQDVATLYKPIDVDLLRALVEVQLAPESGAIGSQGSVAADRQAMVPERVPALSLSSRRNRKTSA